jgi:hypothetical protein
MKSYSVCWVSFHFFLSFYQGGSLFCGSLFGLQKKPDCYSLWVWGKYRLSTKGMRDWLDQKTNARKGETGSLILMECNGAFFIKHLPSRVVHNSGPPFGFLAPPPPCWYPLSAIDRSTAHYFGRYLKTLMVKTPSYSNSQGLFKQNQI